MEVVDKVDSLNLIERKEGIPVPSLHSPHACLSLAAWVCLQSDRSGGMPPRFFLPGLVKSDNEGEKQGHDFLNIHNY